MSSPANSLLMTDVITCQQFFLACRKMTICTVVHLMFVEDYLLVAVIVKSENPKDLRRSSQFILYGPPGDDF
jgi:hypothetical protein